MLLNVCDMKYLKLGAGIFLLKAEFHWEMDKILKLHYLDLVYKSIALQFFFF